MTTKQDALSGVDQADASLVSLSQQLAQIEAAAAESRSRLGSARAAIDAIPSVTGLPPFEPIVLEPGRDLTAALNAALAAPGDYRYLPAGSYPVSALESVRPRSGQLVVAAPSATLLAIPHDQRASNVLLLDGLSDCVWVGGLIVGDRVAHVYTALSGTLGTHEWNHGLRIRASRNCTVRDLAIRECAGDGASIGGTDVTLDGVLCDLNRRNGITLGGSTRARILNCTSRRTGRMPLPDGTTQDGAANGPWAGIDIEPDGTGVVDGLIRGGTIELNQSSGIVALVRSGLKFDLAFDVEGVTLRDNSNGIESASQDGTRTIAYSVRGCTFDRVRAQGIKLMAGSRATIGGAQGSADRNRFIALARFNRIDRELQGISTLAGYTNDISKRTNAQADVLWNLYE